MPEPAAYSVLILGGYGTFGGRLAQLLADEPRLALVIAGRSRKAGEKFVGRLKSAATLRAEAFDRDGDVEAQVRAIAPDLVVDASGPFQGYGPDPFRVVRACLALGIDYLDLADAADFVTGIAQFDERARACGIFILAGASSFPVLTAAVVRSLARDMARVEAISGGLAPSPYAGLGRNVMKAIGSYAGKPVAIIRDGKPASAYALIDSRRYTIAPPGRLPLTSTRFALVDVPDLRVLPALWPDLRDVWMGVAPMPPIRRRAMTLLAWLVRLKVLPSLSPLAGLMHLAMRLVAWGEHRGGMFVAVEGSGRGGEKIARSWHLLAEGDDGPLIPSMAAEALVRRCLEGRRAAAGARSAAAELELADYEALFARRQIFTGRREQMPAEAPVYRRLLGDAYEVLPAPIRITHDLTGESSAQGVATVERGTSRMARALAWLIGFPHAGEGIPVTVTFRSARGRELWVRSFAGRSFASWQKAGSGRYAWLLCERFGPLTFAMAVLCTQARLHLVMRHWNFLRIPLPRFLAPRIDAYESAEDGRFNFHVEISHPLTGLIVRYRGWLIPATFPSSRAP